MASLNYDYTGTILNSCVLYYLWLHCGLLSISTTEARHLRHIRKDSEKLPSFSPSSVVTYDTRQIAHAQMVDTMQFLSSHTLGMRYCNCMLQLLTPIRVKFFYCQQMDVDNIQSCFLTESILWTTESNWPMFSTINL